jgi:hypothetical protein
MSITLALQPGTGVSKSAGSRALNPAAVPLCVSLKGQVTGEGTAAAGGSLGLGHGVMVLGPGRTSPVGAVAVLDPGILFSKMLKSLLPRLDRRLRTHTVQVPDKYPIVR